MCIYRMVSNFSLSCNNRHGFFIKLPTPAKTEKFITRRKFPQKQFDFLFFKELAGALARKLITANNIRSRRYGREKADETFTLLSVRWSACSVTAFGGGAESCPTVRAVSSLLVSVPSNVQTGAERSVAEGWAFDGVCVSSLWR